MLSASDVTAIKSAMLELQLIDASEEDNPGLDNTIRIYAVLLFRVIRHMQKVPEGSTYRVVEFGCGDCTHMCRFVFAIAHIYKRKVNYVGVDNDEKAIERGKMALPMHLRESCRFIPANGGDARWMAQVGTPFMKFHSAIFILPIVDSPETMIDMLQRKYGSETVQWWKVEHAPRITLAYQQFLAIFRQVLPLCLEPSASLLIKTSKDSEFRSTLQILSGIAEDLPPGDQEIPETHCLAVTYNPMQTLPRQTLTDIQASMLELQLIDASEKDNPSIDDRIQSHAVLLLRVIQDVKKIPDEETYRVVEFGCGQYPAVFFSVAAIAHLHHRKLMYIGIDKDEGAIHSWNERRMVATHLKASCRFIHGDGSDVKWMKRAGIKETKFHTAIFIHPITLDPDVQFQQTDKLFGKVPDAALLATRAETGPKLKEQHYQFTKMFLDVLPRCLMPSASILVQTAYRDEYSAALDTLSRIAKDLPHQDQEVPPHHSLAVTFKS